MSCSNSYMKKKHNFELDFNNIVLIGLLKTTATGNFFLFT